MSRTDYGSGYNIAADVLSSHQRTHAAAYELQSRLLPIERKLTAFEQSGFSDMSIAPTSKDREEHAALEAQLTQAIRSFSEKPIKEYPSIVEQLVILKKAINRYIY